MKTPTRHQFNRYLADLATLNGVPSAKEIFTVEPSVQRALEVRMQQSNGFLSQINLIPVNDISGDRLGLGIGGPLASRTDTSSADRQTSDPSTLEASGYLCRQTNFDTHLPYSKIDAWASLPDFQLRVLDAVTHRQGLDRIMVGFNGSSAATTTNPLANPLRQDLNIGWLQLYRNHRPTNVLTSGGTAGSVRIGSSYSADYSCIDALVYDVMSNMLDPWYRDDPGLVVILGSNLQSDAHFPLINSTMPSSEQIAADIITSSKAIARRPAIAVPFVPDDALVVTTLDNLSIYYQEGSRRQVVVDNPKRDRIEHYESSNDAYVVEDFGRGCVVENITFNW